MEDKYYKLIFFACPNPGEYPQNELNEPQKGAEDYRRRRIMDFFDTGLFTPQINCGLFITAWIIGILGLCV